MQHISPLSPGSCPGGGSCPAEPSMVHPCRPKPPIIIAEVLLWALKVPESQERKPGTPAEEAWSGARASALPPQSGTMCHTSAGYFAGAVPPNYASHRPLHITCSYLSSSFCSIIFCQDDVIAMPCSVLLSLMPLFFMFECCLQFVVFCEIHSKWILHLHPLMLWILHLHPLIHPTWHSDSNTAAAATAAAAVILISLPVLHFLCASLRQPRHCLAYF